MRPSAALILAVLPLVLAHTPPLDRRTRHAEVKRQLLGRPTEDDDPVLPDLIPQSATSFAPVAPPRSSTPTAAQTTSAITTSPRATSARSTAGTTSAGETSLPVVSGVSTSASGTISGVLPTSVSGSISGSASRNSTGGSSTSASSASSSVPSASASASTILHTSVDEGGRVVIVTQYYTPSASSASSAAAAASSTPPTTNDGPAISVGAIIGISVAVGVVILGLIGCAVWRMKRRGSDEDEAIRWPELNRHGDSDTHHALPARATGKHGIETDALERSLSNSSDVYMTQTGTGRPISMPMALGGSNFGAASALDYTYTEKDISPNPSPPVSHAAAHEYGYGYPSYHEGPSPGDGMHTQQDPYDHDDYTNLPPPLAAQPTPVVGGPGMYDSDSDGEHGGGHGKAASGPATALPVYR